MQDVLQKYLLRIADSHLILGHRLSEWCGHGPILEQDIALTNMALDLIGQSRLYYQYLGELMGQTEDQIVYFRSSREYRNVLLVEYPNTDFAFTIVRQWIFDTFQYHYLKMQRDSSDLRLAGIATKSFKEVEYHLDFSREWMLRLGNGTALSHQKMQKALDTLWPYHSELFEQDELENAVAAQHIGPDLSVVKEIVILAYQDVVQRSNLELPSDGYTPSGGKKGLHSESLGYLLAEMQSVQRSYPGLTW